MNDKLFATIVALAIYIVILLVSVWAVGSAITSGVKAVAGHCGQQYGIESVVSGDWFCPEE